MTAALNGNVIVFDHVSKLPFLGLVASFKGNVTSHLRKLCCGGSETIGRSPSSSWRATKQSCWCWHTGRDMLELQGGF